MKKVIKTITAMLSLLLVLSACYGPVTPTADPENTESVAETTELPTLSDFTTGDVEVHEVLLPWDWQEGEHIDNLYYKRTTNDAGEAVYAVLQASNGQPFYLPMGSTVMYTGEYPECFFERYTVTYKEDGVDKSFVQYQLYISNSLTTTLIRITLKLQTILRSLKTLMQEAKIFLLTVLRPLFLLRCNQYISPA